VLCDAQVAIIMLSAGKYHELISYCSEYVPTASIHTFLLVNQFNRCLLNYLSALSIFALLLFDRYQQAQIN
jgi:hypothetical protein